MLRQIQPNDYDAVCKFVTHVFVNKEPMCKALHLKDEVFLATFSSLICSCCASPLSALIENENGRIDAVSLALPYSAYFETKIMRHKTIEPLLAILDMLNDIIHPQQTSENTIYHFIIGTATTQTSKGLASLLVNHTVAVGKSMGFRYIVADATNKISQHILINKFGYTQFCQIAYKEFLWDNQYWFKDIADESIMRVIKELD